MVEKTNFPHKKKKKGILITNYVQKTVKTYCFVVKIKKIIVFDDIGNTFNMIV